MFEVMNFLNKISPVALIGLAIGFVLIIRLFSTAF